MLAWFPEERIEEIQLNAIDNRLAALASHREHPLLLHLRNVVIRNHFLLSPKQITFKESVELHVLVCRFLSFHKGELSSSDEVDIRLARYDLIFEVNNLVEAEIKHVDIP